jgi:hypothetical protein
LVALVVEVLAIIPVIWEPLPGSLLYSNDLLDHALELFIGLRVLFIEVLKLPLGQYPAGEIFNNFSLGNIMNLSPQFSKATIIFPKTLALGLLTPPELYPSTRVGKDPCEIFGESLLKVVGV